MPRGFGMCPICKEYRPLTRHHILPRRFFKKRSKDTLDICRKCHDRVEMNIPLKTEQSIDFYYKVLSLFGIFLETL